MGTPDASCSPMAPPPKKFKGLGACARCQAPIGWDDKHCDPCIRAIRAERAAKSEQTYRIFFQNITQMGPKSEGILSNLLGERPELAKCEVLAFQETHTMTEELAKKKSWLNTTMKVESAWSPARPNPDLTAKSRGLGGTCLACRQYIRNSFIVADEGVASEQGIEPHGLDWTSVTMKGRILSFVVVSIYLRPKARGDHLVTLQQIRRYVLHVDLPFLMVGDYNLEPEELVKSGLLAGLKVHILTPKRRWNDVHSGHITTCHQGGSAKLIDYCIVDFRIAAIAQCIVQDTPWPTHKGLIVKVRARWDSLMARVVKSSKPFPFEADALIKHTRRDVLKLDKEELDNFDAKL